MGLTLSRFCVVIAVLVGLAFTSAAQCPEPGVNQAEFGTDGWNGYVYDAMNNFDPSVFIGRKNQSTSFSESFGTGTTDVPASCAFSTETFSVRFKNRQTFSCGLHTFTVGSDYAVRFSIDGGNTFLINIPSGTGYSTTDATVHLTGGIYDLVLEYYHNTGAQQVSFSYSVVPGPGDFAGEISGDQTICDDPANPAAFTSLSGARFCSELAPAYQWQVSVDGGAPNDIIGATSPTFDPPSGIASGNYLYSRKATAGGVTIVSNEISVVADIPLGNETSFGIGQWLAYAYEGADNYTSGNYLGYFEETPLAFSEDFSGVTINGCDLPVEGFTVRFKREETIATCDGYDITIDSEGGGARLYVDGTLVIDGYAPVAPPTTYSANLFLDVGSHQFILEYYNNTGAHSVGFGLTATTETGGGGVIGSDQAACAATYDPAPFTNIEDADFCSGSFTYQWQSSPDGSPASWSDIIGEQSATFDETALLGPGTYYYRREASGAETVYSNIVVVEVQQPQGDEITIGADPWRVFAYQGSNIATADYLGYFDIATAVPLDEDFTCAACEVPINGCDLNTDDFSARFRSSQTLVCGGYDVSVGAEGGAVRLFVNGDLVINGNGANTTYTVYTQNVYLSGVTEFAIEYSNVTGTNRVTFDLTNTSIDGSGGIIGGNQDLCMTVLDPAPFTSLSDANFCSGLPVYSWEQSPDGVGSWLPVSPTESGESYDIASGLAPGLYYFRRAATFGATTLYSNVVELAAYTPETPATEFGDNEWFGYVYDNENDFTTNYKGYITEPTNFDESFCAGLCEFPTNGCPVVATEFSVLFKNRADFQCGSYLITIGGDDGVQLSIGGTIVPELNALTPHSYTTYSKVIYFDGTPDTELELKYFESAGGNRVSFSAVFLGPGYAGEIGGNQYSCAPITPVMLTNLEDATSCTSAAIDYQWQYSLDGFGWSDITTNGTGATYSPPDELAVTHYYRRQANMDGYTLNSNVVTVEIDPPQGDGVTYGQNEWIGYVYDNFQDGPTWNAADYHGYFIANTNFDRSFCGFECMQAINGCDFFTDTFSIRLLNEMTVECGYYRITIGFDDGGRLFIDGAQVLSEYWIHGAYTVLETEVFLAAGTHQFQYDYREDLFGNRVSFNIEFLGAGTPARIGNHQVLCSGADDPAAITQFAAPAFCSPDPTPAYQWQISTDNIAWSDIPSATSISYNPPAGHTFTAYYRRKDTNDIGDELISDVVTIAYNTDPPPFDGDEFGTAPEWIGHVYNGQDNFSDYQGSFIETMVGDAFDESFCGPNCVFPLDGCDIVTNTFTVQFKTQIDLPAGEYTFTVSALGAARLIISGEEIAVPNVIINDYSLEYSFLPVSSAPLELEGGTYFLVLDYYEGFDENRVSFSYIFTPLPVTWHYFNGYYADGNAYLEWRTASEINNSGFEVERSTDGATFTKIGWVEGNGSTTVEQQYLFTDENPEPGWNYYRLKQIDYDEKFEYSRLIPVFVDDLPQVEIYPNPFRDHIFLSRVNTERPPEVTLTNMLGQRSWKLTQDPMQPARFNLPVRLEPGVYSARIRIGDAIYTRKVIIE